MVFPRLSTLYSRRFVPPCLEIPGSPQIAPLYYYYVYSYIFNYTLNASERSVEHEVQL